MTRPLPLAPANAAFAKRLSQTLPADIRYHVYVADEPQTLDPAAPLLTTAPGATSIILTDSDSPLIALDEDAYYGVRAVDAEGNTDRNETFVRRFS